MNNKQNPPKGLNIILIEDKTPAIKAMAFNAGKASCTAYLKRLDELITSGFCQRQTGKLTALRQDQDRLF